ncbi:12733_t:CDS:2, partial [Funneliformis mosseae]
FLESAEKPSLIKFLEFRLREGNLSDSKIEYRCYNEELDTITEYLSDSSEIVKQELHKVIQNENRFYKEKSRLRQDSASLKNKEDELDFEEKYQQMNYESVVNAENNPFLGSKNNLDRGNESVSDTEIMPETKIKTIISKRV